MLSREKSLEQLENEKIERAHPETLLTKTVYLLWSKPLKDYAVRDLRVMIGQGFGLKHLVPIAIERLSENPFVEGDYYPGDLLNAVLNISPKFWKEHSDLYWEVAEIVAGLPDIIKKLIDSIQSFDKIEEDL
jgi:hypothetical protein